MEEDKTDIAIIGAGVIGCAIAYLLSREGIRVMVLEQDSIGSHASGFANGSLSPATQLAPEVVDLMLPLTLESYRMHKVFSQELKEEVGIDYHFRQADRITLAFTEEEANELKYWVDSMRKRGIKVQWVDREVVQNLESRVSNRIKGAAYNETRGVLDSYGYNLALAQAAEKYGAEIRNRQVIGLKKKGTKLISLQTPSGNITCERLILAMGPWVKLASQWLSFPIPVRPLKGQSLRFQISGSPFFHQLTWGIYQMETRHDGMIWAGSTKEDVGFDEQPTVEGRDSIINRLLTMVPSFEDAEVTKQMACLRPLCTDGLPIIGEIPEWNGVYIATGHGEKGILLSTVTARIVTDLIVKRHSLIPIQPFAPSRFITMDS